MSAMSEHVYDDVKVAARDRPPAASVAAGDLYARRTGVDSQYAPVAAAPRRGSGAGEAGAAREGLAPGNTVIFVPYRGHHDGGSADG
jgi:hypothetical protein